MDENKIMSCRITMLFQAGHKYLFSDITLNWEDAMAECQLYGGWLVSIKRQAEQNCLVRHGRSQGYDTNYWTDGKSVKYLKPFYYFQYKEYEDQAYGCTQPMIVT